MPAARSSVVSAAVGAALLVGSPAVWFATRVPTDVGDPSVVAAPAAPTPAPPDSPAVGEAAPIAAALQDAALAARGPARPVGLRIAALDVDAPLDPVALEDDGAMELPDDAQRVGWYEPGVLPGEAGSAVLAGHVDSRDDGPGALFELRHLEPGETIHLELEDGRVQPWTVTARTTYDRESLPIDELFRWRGPALLKIITCGGDFDPRTGSYESNVVVHAIPA